MTTPTQAASAEAIRKAALGREPNSGCATLFSAWLWHCHTQTLFAASDFLDTAEAWWNPNVGTDTRRTFLLFVACALEG